MNERHDSYWVTPFFPFGKEQEYFSVYGKREEVRWITLKANHHLEKKEKKNDDGRRLGPSSGAQIANMFRRDQLNISASLSGYTWPKQITDTSSCLWVHRRFAMDKMKKKRKKNIKIENSRRKTRHEHSTLFNYEIQGEVFLWKKKNERENKKEFLHSVAKPVITWHLHSSGDFIDRAWMNCTKRFVLAFSTCYTLLESSFTYLYFPSDSYFSWHSKEYR